MIGICRNVGKSDVHIARNGCKAQYGYYLQMSKAKLANANFLTVKGPHMMKNIASQLASVKCSDVVPVWIVAHLYDEYGTYMIGLTNMAEVRKWGYCHSLQYNTLEQAESYVRLCLARIERQSAESYERGERSVPKRTRQPYSYFFSHVLHDGLASIRYHGWVEVA